MKYQPAMQFVGAPYRRGGETPAEGFDCFTLVRYVRRHCYGLDTPHAGIPSQRLPAGQACALGIYLATGGRERIAAPWVECAPTQGCAVGLGQWAVRRLHHCGVLVGDGVLHCLAGCGVVWTPSERLAYLYKRVEFFECRS